MQNLTFVGTDNDLETSLLEYGLLVSNEEHEDGSGTHFCIYKQNNAFGTGHISEKEINGYVEGKEFMKKKDITEFFSWSGTSGKKEWIALPLVTKIHELISYYGSENIFGVDYSPITEEKVKELFLNN
jgi:hypothetical protein